MILDVKDLHIKYGEVEAIRGVSFDLMKGEVATIIGANGAGKTTILKSIMGIIKIAGGVINTAFAGEIQNLPPHKIAQIGIGYIPEGREILTRLTVEDNLAIGGFVVKSRKQFTERLKYIYDRFPVLESRKHQFGHSLSGGEQQMLAIARALMLSPQILLMDEPSLGLAPLLIAQVFELIQEFRNDGYSILLIEQNARKALQISERCYVLENGSLVVKDFSRNLINNEDIKKAYLGG